MKESEIVDTFKEFGLKNEEAEIYFSLLKFGFLTATKISRETKMNRSTTYSTTERLIKKGFVNYTVKNNIKYFAATEPKILLELLIEKQEKFKRILPILKNFEPAKIKTKIQIYEGVEGLKSVMRDIIRTNNELLVWGGEGASYKEFPILFKQFINQLKKHKIKQRVLEKKGSKLPNEYKIFLNKTRFVPKEFISPASTVVFGNKIAIGIFSKPYYAVLIEDKDVAQSYRSYFDLIWKGAKKTAK